MRGGGRRTYHHTSEAAVGQPRRAKPCHWAGSSQMHSHGGTAYQQAQGSCARGGLEEDTAPQRPVGGRAPHTTRRKLLWASNDAPSHAIAHAAVHYNPTEAQRIIRRRVVAHGAGLRWIRRRTHGRDEGAAQQHKAEVGVGQPRRAKPRHCTGSNLPYLSGGTLSFWAQGGRAWGGLKWICRRKRA